MALLIIFHRHTYVREGLFWTMGSPDMTSVSVSFEVRRRLNSLRAMEGVKSIDDLLKSVLKEYRLNRLKEEHDSLRMRISNLDDTDIDATITALGLLGNLGWNVTIVDTCCKKLPQSSQIPRLAVQYCFGVFFFMFQDKAK